VPEVIVVLLGVAGSGKTTVGEMLATALDLPFLDADRLHTPECVEQMKRGEPLTDRERDAWFERVLETALERAPLVLACSALRRKHRDKLRAIGEVRMFLLDAPASVLEHRLSQRTGHFFGASLLRSQFETLEPPLPDEAITTVDATDSTPTVLKAILADLQPYDQSAMEPSPLDIAMSRLTRAADYSRLSLVAAGAIAAIGGPPGRRAAARGLASVAVTAAVVNLGLKPLTRRARPQAPDPPVAPELRVPMPISHSFPSGHTAAAFAFAASAGEALRPVAVPLTALAAAVGYSRVHTGVHHPGDVIGGAICGVSMGLAAGRAFDRRFPPRSP
jgi:carbohydrate kinase (thermoresistant glucokinase family)